MNRVVLTIEEARRLGGAIQRLNEIGSSKILIPTHEAEQKGLREYIANTAAAHADEFLACWFAIHNEYEPLIESFASLLQRATRVMGMRAAAAQEAQPESEAKPENVVELPKS